MPNALVVEITLNKILNECTYIFKVKCSKRECTLKCHLVIDLRGKKNRLNQIYSIKWKLSNPVTR